MSGRWLALLAACVLAGCQGRIGDGAGVPGASPGAVPGATASPTASPTPSPTASPSPSPSPISTALAAGVRRLSRREIVAAIEALFPGVQVEILAVDALPADARQTDFTRNGAQIVDPVFAGALETLALAVAEAAVAQQWSAVVPCARGDVVEDACRDAVITALAERAFRGPVTAEVAAGLRTVYAAGVTEGDARLGVQLVIQAVLESPSFLYQRALGDPSTVAGSVTLDGRELAEALALLLTGVGPDAELVAADLTRADVRVAETRRLYDTPAARAHLSRALLEWLRLDRLDEIAKDATTYPDFFGLRPAMSREAQSMVERAIAPDRDTLAELLLTTDITFDPLMQRFYGPEPRPGILTRAAFLSVFASPTETSPVRRGNAILERLACIHLPLPVELMINIVPPTPDRTLTTRERYRQHSSDPACQQCHARIDPLGFAFESFDGMGVARTEENSRPIDTRVDVLAPASVAGNYPGAAELIAELARSAEVEACFVRHVLRFAAGEKNEAFESALVDAWRARPAGAGRSLLDVLLVYVASEAFVTRVER